MKYEYFETHPRRVLLPTDEYKCKSVGGAPTKWTKWGDGLMNNSDQFNTYKYRRPLNTDTEMRKFIEGFNQKDFDRPESGTQ